MSESPDPLEILLEIESLDRVPRTGFLLRGVERPESVAEHSFHLVFLVWRLGRHEDLDLQRAMALALIHDLAEVRTGDLPRTVAGHLPPGAKHGLERAVLQELFGEGDDAIALFEEYVAHETREARFVHDCDRLQLLLKARLYQRWGTGELDELLARVGDEAGSDFPGVAALEERLRAGR
ncbi:MAG TPA: HD domain-containing protein [Thermoanaerobaculia bacterium]|nr:HD domain-containing protein [Thermoanaerobaculia bacterium]